MNCKHNKAIWIRFNKFYLYFVMSIVERIKEIISFSGSSVRSFAINAGMSQATLDKQIKGLRSVSTETIISILSAYPNVSAEWLLRGTGDMFNSKEEKESERINLLLDTIATLQQTINEKSETIKELQNRLNG